MNRLIKPVTASALAGFLLATAGCNLYGFVDKPSGDAQILSLARACFDRSDFTCASTNYGLLSSASGDTTVSEQAFQVLAENGLTMAKLISAAVNHGTSGGKFITRLAGDLSSGAGSTKRLAIFHAYQTNTQIVSTNLRALVRFLTSTALLAEMLGENSTTTGTFVAADMVADASACTSATATQIGLGGTQCAAASTITYDPANTTTIDLTTATDSLMNPTGASLPMIRAALSEVTSSLGALGSSAGLGSASKTFADTILGSTIDFTVSAQRNLFVYLLLTNGIGAAL